jgi:hypothetical protein
VDPPPGGGVPGGPVDPNVPGVPGGPAGDPAGLTAAAGAKWSTRIRVRVPGDAWRQMPLSGSR